MNTYSSREAEDAVELVGSTVPLWKMNLPVDVTMEILERALVVSQQKQQAQLKKHEAQRRKDAEHVAAHVVAALTKCGDAKVDVGTIRTVSYSGHTVCTYVDTVTTKLDGAIESMRLALM